MSSQKRFESKVLCSRGVSLVEFLISLFLSTFVVAVAVSLFSNVRSAAALQGQIAKVNSDLRGSLDIIRDEVMKAGYRSNPAQGMALVFAPANPTVVSPGFSFGVGEVVEGRADMLLIRYQGDPLSSTARIRDCMGQFVPGSAVTIVALRYLPSRQALVCRRLHSPTEQVLLEGVQGLRFEYGVDTNGDRYADRYVTSSNLASGPVVSVKYEVTFRQTAASGSAVTEDVVRRLAHVTAIRNALL